MNQALKSRPMVLGHGERVMVLIPGARMPRSRLARFVASCRRAWARRHALGAELLGAVVTFGLVLFAMVALLVRGGFVR